MVCTRGAPVASSQLTPPRPDRGRPGWPGAFGDNPTADDDGDESASAGALAAIGLAQPMNFSCIHATSVVAQRSVRADRSAEPACPCIGGRPVQSIRPAARRRSGRCRGRHRPGRRHGSTERCPPVHCGRRCPGALARPSDSGRHRVIARAGAASRSSGRPPDLGEPPTRPISTPGLGAMCAEGVVGAENHVRPGHGRLDPRGAAVRCQAAEWRGVEPALECKRILGVVTGFAMHSVRHGAGHEAGRSRRTDALRRLLLNQLRPIR